MLETKNTHTLWGNSLKERERVCEWSTRPILLRLYDTCLLVSFKGCTGLSINLSWSFVSILLWVIVFLIDAKLYQRRKLNPYNKINKLIDFESISEIHSNRIEL